MRDYTEYPILFTLFDIEQAIEDLKIQFQGLRNKEVMQTIEYLSEYSKWSIEEIRNMYIEY